MEQSQYNIRARIGKLSGAVGIICNCLLAAGKLIVGHMTSSMSITADGLNNLSDGASSIVTLLQAGGKAGGQEASLWPCAYRVHSRPYGGGDDTFHRS